MDNSEQLTMKELYENEKRHRQKAEDIAEAERHHRLEWNTIRASSTYSNQLFDSSSTIKAITLQDIRSELDLVLIDDLIVLKPVTAILNRLFKDEEIKEQLKPQGNVEFRRLLGLSTMSKSDQIPPSSNPVTPAKANQKGKGATRDATQAPSHPKDVGAQANAFFMTDRHKYSIEYKLLFKFSAAEIVPALHGNIRPEEEVINELCRRVCRSNNQREKQGGYTLQPYSRHERHPSTPCPSLWPDAT